MAEILPIPVVPILVVPLRKLTLREARVAFTLAFAELTLQACKLGLEAAFDEVTERITAKDPTSDHMPTSVHHIGLAGDLILYRNGVYLTATEQYKPLGELWERMGVERGLPLVWGGRFTSQDGNHFSLGWQGRA
jgi:D-alanyl-D-alanine carboxypeptidase-like protein